MSETSTSLQLFWYTTSWNLEIQNNHQTFIPDIKINLFYMKLNRLDDTRENSDDTVYKNIQ